MFLFLQLVNKHNLSNENKFLSIIASFFMVSFVITSCLDNDNEVNYSPDATIRAFELDTIGYGVNYKFTIDQVSRLIYNVDSLPVNADTIINSILIKTLTTASGIVTMKDQNDQDSIVNINDSIDLTKYVNATEKNNFLVLKVWAPNMEVQNSTKLIYGCIRWFPIHSVGEKSR